MEGGDKLGGGGGRGRLTTRRLERRRARWPAARVGSPRSSCEARARSGRPRRRAGRPSAPGRARSAPRLDAVLARTQPTTIELTTASRTPRSRCPGGDGRLPGRGVGRLAAPSRFDRAVGVDGPVQSPAAGPDRRVSIEWNVGIRNADARSRDRGIVRRPVLRGSRGPRASQAAIGDQTRRRPPAAPSGHIGRLRRPESCVRALPPLAGAQRPARQPARATRLSLVTRAGHRRRSPLVVAVGAARRARESPSNPPPHRRRGAAPAPVDAARRYRLAEVRLGAATPPPIPGATPNGGGETSRRPPRCSTRERSTSARRRYTIVAVDVRRRRRRSAFVGYASPGTVADDVSPRATPDGSRQAPLGRGDSAGGAKTIAFTRWRRSLDQDGACTYGTTTLGRAQIRDAVEVAA